MSSALGSPEIRIPISDILPPSRRWRITMLGEMKVTQGARTITHFRTRKTAALLAYLAFHPRRRHPRSVLVDLLWRDAGPDAGRQSLSTALCSLRHELEQGEPEPTVFVADRFTIGLIPGVVTTDVLEFESALSAAARSTHRDGRVQHLRAAIELYQGELLPGFHEEWVVGESVRLCEAYVNAVAQLTALLEADGDAGAAIAYAQRAIRADPLREAPYRVMMRAYRTFGEPETALRRYRELESVLRDELNEQPSAATRRLAGELARM